MHLPFTVKRPLQVFAFAFAILASVYLLRGQALIGAARDAAFWSLITAAIFAGTSMYYRKTRKQCALCVEETPQQSPEK
ncbi:MAG TPA: hypothetical protein VGT04_07835 [Acidobacteriaceae bacterium]|nr:hypothetical protein [Acidobacteriaceae bacterium]